MMVVGAMCKLVHARLARIRWPDRKGTIRVAVLPSRIGYGDWTAYSESEDKASVRHSVALIQSLMLYLTLCTDPFSGCKFFAPSDAR